MLTDSLSIEQLQMAIGEIDSRLVFDSSKASSLYFDRGQLLEMLGRKEDAFAAYVNILRIEPTHVDALNALGLLIMAAGNRTVAQTLLSGAVLHGPAHAAAHANLAYSYMLDGHLTGARKLYEHALQLEPGLAIAHHGLAELLGRLGDDSGSAHHRVLGLRSRPITIERYTGSGHPIHILALGTAQIGNVPTYGFFDSGVFLLAAITVDFWNPSMPLPPHDIVFNAIGEADLCGEQLAIASAIVDRTAARVVNHPVAVAATSRVANARRLATLDGVVTPHIRSFSRASLTAPSARSLLLEAGFTFPLLVRSPGYHTGDHFVSVERFEDLSDAIIALPGDELFVIEFLDVRDASGLFHKFRVIIVDGTLYPLHLAISHTWKVHYFSADMPDCAEHRAKDAAFLSDMYAVLTARAMAALERVRVALALEYGGIDFAIDASGEVIVFEANASMVVPEPDADARWDYRRKPIARIRSAVRDMLAGHGRTAATQSIASSATSSSLSN